MIFSPRPVKISFTVADAIRLGPVNCQLLCGNLGLVTIDDREEYFLVDLCRPSDLTLIQMWILWTVFNFRGVLVPFPFDCPEDLEFSSREQLKKFQTGLAPGTFGKGKIDLFGVPSVPNFGQSISIIMMKIIRKFRIDTIT